VPIETKLHPPSARPEWVPRRALVQRLAAVTGAKLVLVDAPAGFGKSTLIAQWQSSAAEQRPVAWLSLDPADDDPGCLWWHVVSALHRICPGLGGEDLLRVLQAQPPDLAGPVLPQLINALYALAGPVVLVLDDYHVLSDPACHEQIASFLLHLPPSVLLVLITRADPPLPLARLRAAGDLVEIRTRELRFTAAEAAAFVHAVAAVELSEPDLADLVERTEGWPAGIHLAALSLRSQPSATAVVRQLTGDNRFITDFLAEEVLSRQPAEVRQFLTRTAVLSRFCAPLCDAVTGLGNARQLIDVLDRENLFVVPLDGTRRWFRYHHLFAQMLHAELVASEPGLVAALHERAAAWHRKSGSVGEAVRHSLAAGDAAGAIDLVARHWYGYANAGQAPVVCGWLRALREDQIVGNPLAAHCVAWAAALSGEREPVRRWLPVIEAGQYRGPLPDGMVSLRASAALLRAVYGFEGLRVMRQSARTAAGLETDPGSAWYMLARATHGFSLYLTGELDVAARPLKEAVATQAASTLTGILAWSALSLVELERGRVGRARDLAAVARRVAAGSELSQSPQTSMAYTAAGAVYAAQGRLKEARSEFRHALRLRRSVPGISPWATIEPLLRLGQVLLDLGSHDGAGELIGEADMLLATFPDGAEFLQGRLGGLKRQLAPARRAGGAEPEPLTEREVAVLRLLRGTLSLREIGRELYVSPNTVKTHAQAIYRKLGVSTRHDAVRRGREIGVL
jgi:LuxR family transcriptional regulator, maltose regulon positive regulatory protein